MKVFLNSVSQNQSYSPYAFQSGLMETEYVFANRDVELRIVSKELDKIIDIQDLGSVEYDMEINISYTPKPKPKTAKIK